MATFIGGYSITILDQNKNLFSIIAFSVFAVLIIVAVVNLIAFFKTSKQKSKMNVQQRYDYTVERKEQVEQNYENEEKLVYKSIKRYNIYQITIAFIYLAFIFLLSLSKAESSALIPFTIIGVLLFIGIFNAYIPSFDNKKSNEEHLLDKNDYPKIYEIITTASKKINHKGEIKMVVSGMGIAIALKNNCVYINLKAEEVALLTEEELFAIMIHEFAHYKNEDIKMRAIYSRQIKSFERKDSMFSILSLFTCYFEHTLVEKIYTYDLFSSRKIEREADLLVKELGYSQDFINATAKVALFGLYSEYPWKEVCFDVYENDTPVTDYALRNYNCFIQKVGQYSDKWHFTLKNELPARTDSHPTFKMRMQDLEVQDYFVNFEVPNGNYHCEQTKLLQKASSLAIDAFDEKNNDYKRIRRFAYTERIEAMKKYEQVDSEWNNLSDSELIECAQAYLYINDEKAKSILTEVIERSGSSFACFLLASYYAREYNDECIDLFKRSAVDSSATEEALASLAKYALKTGNQKLIDEYRESVVKKSQSAEEDIQQTFFTKDGLIAPNENYANDVSEIREKLCEYWSDGADGIYLAIRETENQTTVYYIAVQIAKNFSPEKGQKAYEESCYFINRMSKVGKKFYLYFIGKEFNHIKNMSNTCIYKKEKKK
ncbi:MAG: M48 family metalloprotease [Clostridia bacterium]|nr:M48 family metalloprotease [Clostridia bacterium]